VAASIVQPKQRSVHVAFGTARGSAPIRAVPDSICGVFRISIFIDMMVHLDAAALLRSTSKLDPRGRLSRIFGPPVRSSWLATVAAPAYRKSSLWALCSSCVQIAELPTGQPV
jgi:hypothetical protein